MRTGNTISSFGACFKVRDINYREIERNSNLLSVDLLNDGFLKQKGKDYKKKKRDMYYKSNNEMYNKKRKMISIR